MKPIMPHAKLRSALNQCVIKAIYAKLYVSEAIPKITLPISILLKLNLYAPKVKIP